MSRYLRAVIIASLVTGTGCTGLGGSGGDDPGSVTGPSGNSGGLPGAWTGTIARPNGEPALNVRWELGPEVNNGNTGPMTLTNGAVSMTVPGRASVSGNSSQGYTLHISIDANPGTIAGSPNCSVRASPSGAPPPFTSPYRNISISLQMNYSDCQTFIQPPPLRNFVNEVVQLTLSK